MRLLLLTLALVLSSLNTAAQVEENAVWIDVRTPTEFEAGHVEGAIRIPWDGIEKGVAEMGLAKDTPIYLYCGSGGRSGKAKERLDAQQFTAVTNAGGLDEARRLAGQD
jgi:phage shock protein E